MKNIIPVIGLLVLSACQNNKQAQNQSPAEFPVVEATQKTITAYQEFPANIRGINNNDVRAKIQGYVQDVYVDEGQIVTKGAPLFRLETNILTQSAEGARSAVNAGQATIESAQANIVAAEARVKASEVELNKLIPLVEKNIIGSIQLETAKANLAQAQAGLNQAQAAASQAKASYGQAQSNLRGIQENINFSVVRSPITGVVGSIPFRSGSLVGPTDQTPLTVVSDVSKIYAYFSMNEKEYFDFLNNTTGTTVREKLKNLPEVELILANGQLYPEKGKVEAVTGQIDAATGSIQFRVTFANSAGLLSNGNSGKVRVPKTYENVTVFPEMSTFERQGMFYVYKVSADTAYQTVVKIADKAENLVIVSEGIKPGDLVVTQGVAKLKDKTPVKPKKQDLDQLLSTLKPVF